MKILFLKWASFGNDYITKAFERAGVELSFFDFPQKEEDTRHSEELATKVLFAIQEKGVDAVFSFNYFPVVAIAAKAAKVKYISWTYDSPYIQLYSRTIEYDTNYAFVFDQNEYNNLKALGLNTVYYLPMAADTSYYDSITISDKDHKIFDADIAMIGSMYNEKHNNLVRHFEGLDEYTSGYVTGIMAAQKEIYGADILQQALTPEIVKNIQKVCPMYSTGDGFESASWTLSNYFLARKLTSMERFEYIEALSRKYDVTLYTPEKTPSLKVRNMGTVEYYKDSPKAIKCAKINLNITLRSIVTGIPLRAFDIMGCGGFLLTNYQADFDNFFVPDQDYVYFDSLNSLIDKAGYYLEHEDERLRIAQSGYNKVKNQHTFDHRVKDMLNIVNMDI